MSPLSPRAGAPAVTDEAAFSLPRASTATQPLPVPRPGHAPAAPKVARTAQLTAQSPASARTGGALANDEVSA